MFILRVSFSLALTGARRKELLVGVRCPSSHMNIVCTSAFVFFALHSATSQKHIDTLHNVILFGIIWMFFRWNFEYSGDGGIVVLQDVSNVVSHMLIDQDNSNIIAS